MTKVHTSRVTTVYTNCTQVWIIKATFVQDCDVEMQFIEYVVFRMCLILTVSFLSCGPTKINHFIIIIIIFKKYCLKEKMLLLEIRLHNRQRQILFQHSEGEILISLVVIRVAVEF